MRLMLLTMPLGDLTQPYTSLPTLAGNLRPRGVDVTQRDYGVEFAHFWARPENAAELLAGLEEAIAGREDGSLSSEAWEDYVDLKLLHSRFASQVDRLPSIFDELRSPGIIEDVWRLSGHLRVLTAYQNLLGLTESLVYSGSSSFQGLLRDQGRRCIEEPPDVYRRFVEEIMLADLLGENPDIVGLSVTYPRQLFPSLIACAALKRRRPGIPIVLGGAYLSTVVETLLERPELAPWWDFAIDGEGETALGRLIDLLAGGGGDLAQIPNLIYHAGGGIERSPVNAEEDIHALHSPDFRGLNLERYLAPETVFLLPVARGCYMRCTFCAISYATRNYRCRTGEEIVRDIRAVQRQFGGDGARYFNFSIDVMTPKHLREMAESILASGLNIEWDAEIRFDRTLNSDIIKLMSQAGCRHLRFGLESAVDRIRELMDKRISIECVDKILEDCRREDIKTSTMVIIGFPGETEEEARETFRFIYDNNHKIRFFALNVYTVSRGSIIAARPKEFGTVLTMRPDRLVQPSWDFKIGDGLSTQRARQLAGEFRSRLMERYPLADEGFSVGIGGAFTFLITSRWSWDDLLAVDGMALQQRTECATMKPDSVPRICPRTDRFAAPYVYDGTFVRTTDRGVTYFVTPEHRIIRAEAASASALAWVDGRRSIEEIAELLVEKPRQEEIELLCAFFSKLCNKGVLMAA